MVGGGAGVEGTAPAPDGGGGGPPRGRSPPQKPLWQSALARQRRPVPQAPQEPPQSTSLSLPSSTPSLQGGATTTQPEIKSTQANLMESLLRDQFIAVSIHGEDV